MYVAAAPGEPNRLYVVQRRGIVQVLDGGRLRASPFMDLRNEVSPLRGERGLLSIAFHPSYTTNRLVYAIYTARDGAVTVAEYRTDGNRGLPETRRELVRVPHDESLYHNGGQIQFGPDGRLYVGVGDGGYLGFDNPDPHGNSQNHEVLLGKIFALTVDEPQTPPAIVAYGLRNPWRFSFAPSGDLVIADVGWNNVEEVNLLPREQSGLVNFGWSVYEGRRKRTRGAAPELNPAGVLTWPILTYETRVAGNCSITGGYLYRGRAVPRLRGRYVFGDYCSGRIWSVALTGGRAVGKRLEPARAPMLVSFGEDARGELYVLTQTGAIYRIAR